jgi:dTDP-4-amino-4,6-dideoxygalactose transaminase
MSRLRKVPPSAPPLTYGSLVSGLAGIFQGKSRILELERELKHFFGVRYVYLLSSGKAALVLILRALKRLSPGKDEVVIPAYTCFSVPSGIVRAGLRVTACDIDETSFGMDLHRLQETINERTLCVIPTHLFGIPEDVEKVLGICKKTNVYSVEDAAQSMGGVHQGRSLGTFCDVGFFSLGRGKNITCGTGGIVVTDSDDIAREIGREYRNLPSPSTRRIVVDFLKLSLMTTFIKPRLYWIPAMLPFLRLGETEFTTNFPIERLSGLQAGVLKGWSAQLEASNGIRAGNTEFFRARIPSSVRFLPAPCNRFPVLVEDGAKRDRLFEADCGRELGFSRMYPSPVNEIDEIRAQFNGVTFPAAKHISERILTLPTHAFLTREDRERICQLFQA